MFRSGLSAENEMYKINQRHSGENDRRGYASPASGWIAESRNPHPIFVSASFTGPTSLADTASFRSGRFPGYPLLMVTCIIHRKVDLCRVGKPDKRTRPHHYVLGVLRTWLKDISIACCCASFGMNASRLGSSTNCPPDSVNLENYVRLRLP